MLLNASFQMKTLKLQARLLKNIMILKALMIASKIFAKAVTVSIHSTYIIDKSISDIYYALKTKLNSFISSMQ